MLNGFLIHKPSGKDRVKRHSPPLRQLATLPFSPQNQPAEAELNNFNSLIQSLMCVAGERCEQLPGLFVVESFDRQPNQIMFMRTRFYTQTLIALAAAITAATSNIGCAEERPIPPPTLAANPVPTAAPAAATFSTAPAAPTLPPEIAADSSLAQVVKLVQAGVDLSVINNYIANVPDPFNLDAEKIIALTDSGVPAAAVNAMMERDKILVAAASNPPAPAPAPAVEARTVVVANTAPPAAPITVNYFSDTLAPYGTWVDVDGYGRCWRPTVVNYDSGWRPYCDRGHWVYTDYGWYWDSDYSWGATFHYGRWFRNSHLGWCWYPDTEWAPSWVTWRSSDDYRGWAPLPPFAVFHSDGGFFYRGASVSVSFGFGLGSDSFTFVGSSHFYDHHPRRFCPEQREVVQIFNRTTIINNYEIHRDRDDRNDRGNRGDRNDRGNHDRIVNNGLPVAQVSRDQHREIKPVQVASLPNAGRHGWRGNDEAQPGDRDRSNNRDSSGNVSNAGNQRNRQPDARPNDGGNSNRRDNGNQVAGGTTLPTAPQAGGRNDNANQGGRNARSGGNNNGRTAPGVVPQNNSPAPVATTPPQNGNRNDRANRNDNDDNRNRDARPDNNRNGRPTPIIAPLNNPTPQITPPAQVITAPAQNIAGNNRDNRIENSGQNNREFRLGGSGNGRPATAIIPPHNPQPVITAPAQNLERNDRPNRGNNENVGNRVQVTPPARAIQQIEQRPPVEISRPTAPERREQYVPPRNESPRNESARSESRPSRVESAPRSFSPPPAVQAPAPAPAPSQPAARSENQSRNAERNSARTADRDDAHDRNEKRTR